MPVKIPSVGDHLVVSIVDERILVLRLNRPSKLNAMNSALEGDIRKVLDWYEDETSLWCAVVTGTGRVFCAGQDLKEALDRQTSDNTFKKRIDENPHGFGSISRRITRKPLIAALNGSAYGGGGEIATNCDIIIGCKGSVLSFPEVRRGLFACVGGIPNTVLRSPSMIPYLLNGTPIPQTLLEQHIFTEVVEAEQVMPTALKWARSFIECSPDAVQATKQQIISFKNGLGVEGTVKSSLETDTQLYEGQNILEGLKAFGERREPKWSNPPRFKAKL
ncbi:ClpP/crotonase [Meredithblackwellia eburnea MCA 4105]